MGKGELVALLIMSLWCLVIVVWLFLAEPWVCLQFVIVVFPDQTHYFKKEIQYFLDVITCDPSIYALDHSDYCM